MPKNLRPVLTRLALMLLLAAGIVAFWLLRENRAAMNCIVETLAPVKRSVASLCAATPWSVAEIAVAAAIVLLALWAVRSALQFIFRLGGRLLLLAKKAASLGCLALALVLALCLFLGASYYSDSFSDKSGLSGRAATLDELEALSRYFAVKARETGALVQRDSLGVCTEGLDAMFDGAAEAFSALHEDFPFLEAPALSPKRFIIPTLMSRFGYTGFYFPFTGEATINTDCPRCLLPSTLEHEIAHQRGVQAEDEANFVAILACTRSDDAAFAYSGWLLGYIHLTNALYAQDAERFWSVYGELSPEVEADLRYNNQYWERYESDVSDASEAVYDAMLKTYGQELGVKSYGAVVDLLMAYFLPEL